MPGDSASESQGPIGVRTAKLSPKSGNAAGAVAEYSGSVPNTVPRHPYSGMSADDYNVEPTGTLGLTADELVSVGNEFIYGTTPTGLDRDEKLFTSTISRPISWVPVVHDPESIRTDLIRQRPGNVLHPKRALTFRNDHTGSLVRMPNFVECNCDRCQETVSPADSDRVQQNESPSLPGKALEMSQMYLR